MLHSLLSRQLTHSVKEHSDPNLWIDASIFFPRSGFQKHHPGIPVRNFLTGWGDKCRQTFSNSITNFTFALQDHFTFTSLSVFNTGES